MRRVLAKDPDTGVVQWIYYDEENDAFHMNATVDAQPLIDLNKKFYNADHGRFGDGKVVGRVQMPLWWNLKRAGIIDDDKALRRWLNDSDNRGFRVRPGRV